MHIFSSYVLTHLIITEKIEINIFLLIYFSTFYILKKNDYYIFAKLSLIMFGYYFNKILLVLKHITKYV